MLANGDHLRVVAQPLPDGGLRLIFEDRTEQVRLASARDTLLRVRAATFDNLFEAISVFACDGRLYLWNRRFSEVWELDEEWLAEHPRVDELVPAMAKQLVNPTAAAQVRELVRSTTSERQSANGPVSLTDGRHFEFAAVPLPDGNALFTMVDVTDSSADRGGAARARDGAGGGRPGQDRLRRQHELRAAHAADLDRRLRRDARRRAMPASSPPAAADYVGAILESVDAAVEADRRRARPDPGRHPRRGARARAGRPRRPVPRGGRDAARRAPTRRRRSSRSRSTPSAGIVIGDARRLRESVEHVLRNAIAYTDRKAAASALDAERRRRAGGDHHHRQWPGHRARGPGRGCSTASTGRRAPACGRGGARPRPAADPPVHRGAWRHGRAGIEAGQGHDGHPDHPARRRNDPRRTRRRRARSARSWRERCGRATWSRCPGRSASARRRWCAGLLAGARPRGRGAEPELRDRPAL